MMSLLWYYLPQHVEVQEHSISGEIYASRHRDTNSVACIDDKCYVLAFNEYCRYKRRKAHLQPNSFVQPSRTSSIVPESEQAAGAAASFSSPSSAPSRIPPINILPELVFFCRKVYDFRQRRILKNPC